MLLKYTLASFLFIILFTSHAQVVINEVLSSNSSGILDEEGSANDWIELYNDSDSPVNLDGYRLNDKYKFENSWQLPPVTIAPGEHFLVFASDKNRYSPAYCYKTIITEGDQWSYFVPEYNYPDNAWRTPQFDDSAWQRGNSGFGYGDNDDNTVINPLNTIYIRKEFEINNPDDVYEILLHVDYDDAFAAFINGKLVASNNLAFTSTDNYNEVDVQNDHEAAMYSGGEPDKYVIQTENAGLKSGINVLSIQGYNITNHSSDFSLIPFLTIASTSIEEATTEWFISNSCTDEGYHTNFKISSEGETIYLYMPNGSIADSIQVPQLYSNVSYGRFPDGSNDFFYFMAPTPRLENANPEDEMLNPSLTFSPEAGYYNATQNISIQTNLDNVEVRYTTDGSKPDSSSQLFTSPIGISNPTTLRAAIFRNQTQIGETAGNTYLVNARHSLPVVSLATAPKNFFDYNEGILVEGPNAQPSDPHYGANYWMDWEKEVHFELFDVNGNRQINQGAGVKVTGNYSRMWALKSLALYARSQYGKGSFQYKFFNDRSYDKFETLLLRNSGNDFGYTMIRDGFVSEISKTLDLDRLAFQPSIVYLNGEYWGILNMRDKPNEHYFKNNYNIEEEELNLLEGNNSVIHGSASEYQELMNYINNRELSNDEAFAHVEKQIDIDCFIGYQLVQLFINNGDWPGNNIKYWKSNSPNSRWRWLLYDTDFGMGLYNVNKYNENTLVSATATNSSGWSNPPWSTLLFRKLLTNTGFKHQFINRAADLMNTIFSPLEMNNKIDSIVAIVEPEMDGHLNKWGGSMNSWNNRINEMKTFSNNRPTYMRNHIQSFFQLSNNCSVTVTVSNSQTGKVKINTITPQSYPFGGVYFSNVPVKFKALPEPGYRFVRWEGNSQSTEPEIELLLNGTSNLHAVFEQTGQNEANIVFNEINYRSDDTYDSGDWIEIFNHSNFAVDLFAWRITDKNPQNAFVFPQNTILYPGDYLVICADQERFSYIYPKVKNVIGIMEFGLSSDGETLSLYNPEMSLIDQVYYLPTTPWPTAPANTSSTLELVSPWKDNSKPEWWAAGPAGGTPGAQNSLYTSINQKPGSIATNAQCSPSPFVHYTTLSFNSYVDEKYTISICNPTGKVLQTINGNVLFDGRQYIDIFTDQYKFAPGVYIVIIKTEDTIETLKVVKGHD